jgi:anti-sigma regulatory factor (Ser/Thr protein kinase)
MVRQKLAALNGKHSAAIQQWAKQQTSLAEAKANAAIAMHKVPTAMLYSVAA